MRFTSVFLMGASLAAVVIGQSTVTPPQQQAFQQHALTHRGDAGNGRRLFMDEQRTKCATCHQIDGSDEKVGPNLSHIGGKFDRPHLIESLLEPSRQMVEGYRTSAVLTKSGHALTGIIKENQKDSFMIQDAAGKRIQIDRSDVQDVRTSDVSLMPQGLVDVLSKDEFTDLIAYMETLRSGVADKPGAGIGGPVELPHGFKIQTMATGLTGATALETVDDGRILLCEQTGALRVFKDGRLLDEPMLRVNVDRLWERGLIGVTVHPLFPSTPYVYVCYVAKNPYPHHRISRFTIDGDVAVERSEEILLRGEDQSKLGGEVPAGHQGGALHFGVDGKLYVGIGEQTAKEPAQMLDTFQGKILRINDDGSIPTDNPFVDQASGKYRAIWAVGCRNPFTFAVDAGSGQMLINDVGGKFEEINRGAAGANYGWPTLDHGFSNESGFVGPIHVYPQASISGGDFAPQAAGPRYSGRYFFADFVHGWIKSIDPEQPAHAAPFASGLRRPVDLRFANDGSLYVLLRNAWVIDGKFESHTGSLLKVFRKYKP